MALATLLLSLLAGIAATVAAVLALTRPPAEGAGDRSPAEDVNPFAQQGTVKPEGQAAGTVFYPVPYTNRPWVGYCVWRRRPGYFVWPGQCVT